MRNLITVLLFISVSILSLIFLTDISLCSDRSETSKDAFMKKTYSTDRQQKEGMEKERRRRRGVCSLSNVTWRGPRSLLGRGVRD